MGFKIFTMIFLSALTILAGNDFYYKRAVEITKEDLDTSNQVAIEIFDDNPKSEDLEALVNQLPKIESEPIIPIKQKQEILFLLNQLKTKDREEVKKIKIQILEKAKISSETREFIIYQLLKNVDFHDFETIKKDRETRLIWESSTDILGDLEAEEAIKYFIQCLDCGYAFSNSNREYRASFAILKLKEKAVPSLILALRNGRIEIRETSVTALTWIGGHLAKQALESALKTEKDEQILKSIEYGLRGLNRRLD